MWPTRCLADVVLKPPGPKLRVCYPGGSVGKNSSNSSKACTWPSLDVAHCGIACPQPEGVWSVFD